jgi:ribosome maturation protein Sdo1
MGSNYTLVRYQHGGEKYEILVDPDKGLSYKKGEPIDIANVILIDTIFTDANKGEKASESKLKAEFGTSDPLEVSKLMFEKGTFLLTAAQRKEMTEQKIQAILNILARKRLIEELFRRNYAPFIFFGIMSYLGKSFLLSLNRIELFVHFRNVL